MSAAEEYRALVWEVAAVGEEGLSLTDVGRRLDDAVRALIAEGATKMLQSIWPLSGSAERADAEAIAAELLPEE